MLSWKHYRHAVTDISRNSPNNLPRGAPRALLLGSGRPVLGLRERPYLRRVPEGVQNHFGQIIGKLKEGRAARGPHLLGAAVVNGPGTFPPTPAMKRFADSLVRQKGIKPPPGYKTSISICRNGSLRLVCFSTSRLLSPPFGNSISNIRALAPCGRRSDPRSAEQETQRRPNVRSCRCATATAYRGCCTAPSVAHW